MPDYNFLEKTFIVQEKQKIEYKKNGGIILGPWSTHLYNNDPKHLTFSLSRYKFVSKILKNYQSILEIGCGDAFGSMILSSSQEYIGIDIDDYVISDNVERYKKLSTKATFLEHDILQSPLNKKSECAFSLDVIEHIEPKDNSNFILNIKKSVSNGPILIGTPNIYSQEYASEYSKESHINLHSLESLSSLLSDFYNDVFEFGMNDEVVHTGFSKMCHYIFVLASNPK